VRYEIGEGLLARYDECRQPREKPDQQQQAAEGFDDRRQDGQAPNLRGGASRRDAEEFRTPGLQERSAATIRKILKT
jgi:hypothetical protein